MREHALATIPKVFLIKLSWKHALFWAFQIAQQVTTIRKSVQFGALGSKVFAHSQHWTEFLGMSLAPILWATIDQITFVTGHLKCKCCIFYYRNKRSNWGFPIHIVLNKLSFIKIAFFSISQRNILILAGILFFRINLYAELESLVDMSLQSDLAENFLFFS
jgi:hypothetical protein